MATFYGGDQLTRVIPIEAAQSTATNEVTVYTCPAGHYAYLEIKAMVGNCSEGVISIRDTSNSVFDTQIRAIFEFGGFVINHYANGSFVKMRSLAYGASEVALNTVYIEPFVVSDGQRVTFDADGGSNNATFQVLIKEYKLP